MGFPSSFSEKTQRFCHAQRKETSLPGCAKVHQLHGKTIPTWGTSHQQLWNPSGIWWIDSAPGAAGDCRASHRNARFAPRRGDIWPASYGYAGQRWTNLRTERNTIWRLGRPSRSKWYMVNCWHQSVLTYWLPDMIGVHSAEPPPQGAHDLLPKLQHFLQPAPVSGFEPSEKCWNLKLSAKLWTLMGYQWDMNCIFPYISEIIEGSLEVKLPTIWTVEKQRWEESEEKRSEERRCRCAKR